MSDDMPSATPEQTRHSDSSLGNNKKRRREDHHITLQCPPPVQAYTGPIYGNVVSATKRKKTRHLDPRIEWARPRPGSPIHVRHHLTSPLRGVDSPRPNEVQGRATSGAEAPPVKSQLEFPLRPCHNCNRKPVKKSDIDAFADCEACGKRTCFVCIRECEGYYQDAAAAAHADESESSFSRSFIMDDADDVPAETATPGVGGSGHSPVEQGALLDHAPKQAAATQHRRVICSRCCVERGEEGAVICFGCLALADG